MPSWPRRRPAHPRHAARCGAGLLLATAALAGCGPAPLTTYARAAEPAVSPPLTTTPAGQVLALPVGSDPEGLAVDAVTATVAVALRHPDRLGLLSTGGGAVRLVAVPASARHLELLAPGGPLLVPGEDTDLLLQVALPDGTVVHSVLVGRQPHDAVAAAGRVLDADELGGSVTISAVQAGADVVLARYGGPVQPGGVAAAGQRALAVDVRGERVYVYDLRELRPLTSLPAGTGPTHAVGLDSTHVVVTDTVGGALLLYSLGVPPRGAPSGPLQRLVTGGRPYGIGVDVVRHRVWVALSASNTLLRFDYATTGPAAGQLHRVGPAIPTVRGPYSVAVDTSSGAVWVAGVTDAQLQRIPAP